MIFEIFYKKILKLQEYILDMFKKRRRKSLNKIMIQLI